MVLKKETRLIALVIGVAGFIVFVLSLIMLFYGDELDALFNVIGIRVVAIFIAFASFLTSMLFSLLILQHNKTTVRINDDTNRRAELFRELQFASANYSIIDFIDRMLIYGESERYINRLVEQKSMMFNVIINLIMKNDSLFYKPKDINIFTKIKIYMNIKSLLGVTVKGNSELYFTNPEQIEGDNTNTYSIHSSNFLITEQPKISTHQ